MVKKWLAKRIMTIVLILFIVFITAAAAYFYLEAQTNISSLNTSMLFIKDFVKGDVLESIQSAISNLNEILIVQTVSFLVTGVSLVLLVWHMFSLFSIQRKGALVDVLTRLHNRRAILAGLKRELARAKRYKHSISLAMIDIDHFKELNDVNGHLTGDKALKKLAHIFEKNVRETDLVGRTGGDEFMIIFPETDLKQARKVCDSLRKVVEKTHFVGEDNIPSKFISVSVGVAGLQKGKGTRKQWHLIGQADEKLYDAKRAGGNTVK